MKAIKEFEMIEGSTSNMWYLINVRWRGVLVDRFHFPTMKEAKDAFAAAGYKVVSDE